MYLVPKGGMQTGNGMWLVGISVGLELVVVFQILLKGATSRHKG